MSTNQQRQMLIVKEFLEAMKQCNNNPGVVIIAMTNEQGHARIWNCFDEGQKFPMIALSSIIHKQIMEHAESIGSVINTEETRGTRQ